jgi:hypothetical protein
MVNDSENGQAVDRSLMGRTSYQVMSATNNAWAAQDDKNARPRNIVSGSISPALSNREINGSTFEKAYPLAKAVRAFPNDVMSPRCRDDEGLIHIPIHHPRTIPRLWTLMLRAES